MAIPDQLKQIAEGLQKGVAGVKAEQSLAISNALEAPILFIEAVDACLTSLAPPHSELLRVLSDEIFIDVHVASALALGGKIKGGAVLMRTAIESALYTLHFLDHRVEAQVWANHGTDLSFTGTLLELCSVQYLHYASGASPSEAVVSKARSALQVAYRELSERVHGKYRLLAVNLPKEQQLESFCALTRAAFEALTVLCAIRCAQETSFTVMAPNAQALAKKWQTRTS